MSSTSLRAVDVKSNERKRTTVTVLQNCGSCFAAVLRAKLLAEGCKTRSLSLRRPPGPAQEERCLLVSHPVEPASIPLPGCATPSRLALLQESLLSNGSDWRILVAQL